MSVMMVTDHLLPCERGEAPMILLRGFFFADTHWIFAPVTKGYGQRTDEGLANPVIRSTTAGG
jgi:hypothetical protein